MRVLMVSKAVVTGVYQRKLEELASFPDIELMVVAPPYWDEGRVGRQKLERAFTGGYDLVVEPMRFNGHHHVHWYPGLSRLMRRFRPELVHIDEEPFNLVTAHAMRLARLHQAKSLFFTWQNIEKEYPPPFRWFEAAAFRQASAAIAGNQAALEILRRKGYRGPVRVIPQFGVDPDIYRPIEPCRALKRPPIVAYYGRLVPEKGVDILLRALARTPETVRGLVIGAGTSRQELVALGEHLGVSQRVEFRDPVPAERIPGILSGVAMVVVPSRTQPNWKEQFGRVLIESMACGAPVIGSDSGEIPHVIGDAGLVFPEGDDAALARAIMQVLEDETLATALAEAGRRRVLDRFTQQQIAAATRALYLDII